MLAHCGFTLARTLEDVPVLSAQPGWAELTAVREGRVFAIDCTQYLNCSGPRLIEAAELLARVLWGERLGGPVDESGCIHEHECGAGLGESEALARCAPERRCALQARHPRRLIGCLVLPYEFKGASLTQDWCAIFLKALPGDFY